MKIPKIFRNDVRDYKAERDYRGRYTSFKLRVKKFFRWILGLAFKGAILYAVLAVGILLSPKAVSVVAEATSNVPPVLQRIFECESKGQQFGKSGQVLMNANTNDTVDMGIAQINTVWFSKATELGLDLTKEEDNIKMAVYIFENHGSSPWNSSKLCWNK